MFRNVAGQHIIFIAYDTATGLLKTGDAGNLTAYQSIDSASPPTVLADASATEISATLAKGAYVFDLAQGETNGDMILYTCNSVTSGIQLDPVLVFTQPAAFQIAGGAAGGVFIAGTNAAVTITGSGNALTLTSTGANGNGLATTGNGTGNGILATGGTGAHGDGVEFVGGGAATGAGIRATGGGTSGDLKLESGGIVNSGPLTQTGIFSSINAGNDIRGVALATAYDPAKTAAQAGDAMTLTAAYDAAKTALQSGGDVNAKTMNAATIYGDGTAGNLWRGSP